MQTSKGTRIFWLSTPSGMGRESCYYYYSLSKANRILHKIANTLIYRFHRILVLYISCSSVQLYSPLFTPLAHFLQIRYAQLSHFLQLVYKTNPFLDFLYEVPRRSEVEHDDKECFFKECGGGKLTIYCRIVDFFDHIDFKLSVCSWV
jgi:hypothetical protein